MEKTSCLFIFFIIKFCNNLFLQGIFMSVVSIIIYGDDNITQVIVFILIKKKKKGVRINM